MQDGTKVFLEKVRAFLQKNAYGVTLGVCLAVIVGTAIYVRWPQEEAIVPEEEFRITGAQDESVQRLSDVQTTQLPSVAPTAQPLSVSYAISAPTCVWPVSGSVMREHSADRLVYMTTMERYETHAGVDIAGEKGERVVSPMSGTVGRVYKDALWGQCIVLAHPDGLESTICGVKANAGLREGVAVGAGEAIGVISGDIAYESHEDTHVHWTLTRDGAPIDPRSMVRE